MKASYMQRAAKCRKDLKLWNREKIICWDLLAVKKELKMSLFLLSRVI